MDIYVGNLCKQAMNTDLKKHFSVYGSVLSVQIMMDNYTHRSRGFALVKMETRQDGEEVIRQLHNTRFMDQLMVVRATTLRESATL